MAAASCLLTVLMVLAGCTSSAAFITSCSCTRDHNTYTVNAAANCESFQQSAPGISATTQCCALGTRLDLTDCVCKNAAEVTCPAGCGVAHPPACAAGVHPGPAPPPTDGGCECERNGNYYRPVSNNHCRSFVQSTAPGIVAGATFHCAGGTAFDTVLCVCSSLAVTCPSTCQTYG